MVQDVKERLHWAVDEFMARRDVLFISASRSDSVVILLQPGKLDGDARHRARRRAAARPSTSCCPRSPSRSASAARTASWSTCARATTRPATPSRSAGSRASRRVIASFDDLGSYGLLLGLQDTLSLAGLLRQRARQAAGVRRAELERPRQEPRLLPRGQRPLGRRRREALRAPSHAALPHEARRGDHRPRPRPVAGPHGVLAGPQGQGAHRPGQEGQVRPDWRS